MTDVLTNALGNAVVGISTVFAVLVLISLIIYCFNIIPYIEAKFKGVEEEPKAAPAKPTPAPKAPLPPVEPDVPVAAIMAAIYAYEESVNGYTGGFYVRSIKRRK